MRKFFVKNILFVFAVNILIKPAWIFFIDRTVQNRVGHAGYGTYLALLNLGLIFQIILDMGITNYNTRMVSQEPRRLRVLFPVMLTARLLLMLVYTAVVLTTGWILGFHGADFGMLCGVLLIQTFNVLLLYIRSNIAALQKFRLDGMLSATDKFLMILLCGIMLYTPLTGGVFRIEWFIGLQVLCYAVATIIAWLVLRRLTRVSLTLSFDAKLVKRIIRESIPFATLIFLMAVYTRADTLLIVKLCGEMGKEEAGIYAAAYRLLDVGNTLGILFAGILLPLFGRMFAEKQDIAPILRLCVNILIPIAFMVSITAFFWGTEIMHLLYKDTDAYMGKIFAAVMACFPPFCIMYIYSTLLTAHGNLKLLNYISIVAVVLNLGLNSFLIPAEGALGAGITAACTQFFVSVCFLVFSKKKIGLPTHTRWLAAHLVFLLLLSVIALFLRRLPSKWELQVMLFGLCTLAGMFLFRFISPSGIQNLLTSKRTGKVQ